MAGTSTCTLPHLTTLLYTTPSSHNKNINNNTNNTSLFHLRCDRRTQRLRSSTVTRAGPTTSQYIFAFVFPMSLLAITAFSAFQIGNKLDQKYLDELAMNEATREQEEEEDELDEVATPRIEEPALPPSRSRPRREI